MGIKLHHVLSSFVHDTRTLLFTDGSKDMDQQVRNNYSFRPPFTIFSSEQSDPRISNPHSPSAQINTPTPLYYVLTFNALLKSRVLRIFLLIRFIYVGGVALKKAQRADT